MARAAYSMKPVGAGSRQESCSFPSWWGGSPTYPGTAAATQPWLWTQVSLHSQEPRKYPLPQQAPKCLLLLPGLSLIPEKLFACSDFRPKLRLSQATVMTHLGIHVLKVALTHQLPATLVPSRLWVPMSMGGRLRVARRSSASAPQHEQSRHHGQHD